MLRFTGDPARTSARIRSQRTDQVQAMPMNPHAQTLNRIAGSGLGAGGTIATIAGAVNGWLIWFAVTTMLDRTAA
jgi:outer membrane lipoprotein SlyB